MYWITSSRRSCSKSTSISGGSPRFSEMKRANRNGLFRIDRGDAEAIAHGAVGRRAAALAENFLLLPARVVHDVVHGEEIARVVELGDQGELIVEPLLHVGRNAIGIFVLRIALLCARPGEIFQML